MIFKIYGKICNNCLRHVKYLSTNRNFNQNHYEILNVKKDCTCKDIKDAYIKLSKEYHPDRNKSKDSQARFVKIVEAYSVLSKPYSRRVYDANLSMNFYQHAPGTHNVYTGPVGYNPWNDPLFYQNRDRSRDSYYEQQPYYGIKGVNKVSNATIVAICFIIGAIGLGLQSIAIRHSYVFKRAEILKRSEENAAKLNDLKQQAVENGNEFQIKVLKAKLHRNGTLTEFKDD